MTRATSSKQRGANTRWFFLWVCFFGVNGGLNQWEKNVHTFTVSGKYGIHGAKKKPPIIGWVASHNDTWWLKTACGGDL
jgi:hypothetical protein